MTPILAVPCTDQTDAALMRLRDRLTAQGLRVAGVIQRSGPATPGRKPAMILDEVSGAFSATISQDLGAGADGCRLDPGALEETVQNVAGRLAGADILFLNRYGKQEEQGRGFAPLIAQALDADIPVILPVTDAKRASFVAFAGGLAIWTTVDDIADHHAPVA